MKKKIERHNQFLKVFLKFLIMVKTIWLIVMASVLQVSAGTNSSYAQSVKMNIHLENVDLEQVIWTMKKQTEFNFFYSSEDVHGVKKLDIDMENVTAETILDHCLKGTGLAYEIVNKAVIIKKSGNVSSTLFKGSPVESTVEQQKKELSGTVRDTKGLSLPGVTVYVKGSTMGTITDNDGNFKLSVPLEAKTLVFSFVGMKTQEFPISRLTNFSIVLEEETIAMEEVVVVGYGVQKKESAVGAISQVDGNTLKKAGVSTISNALTGKVPGVYTVQAGGQPGEDGATVLIRGKSSWGNSSPLVLVDGVERNYDNIDPNEIESLSVLKDASATAVFGVRGANGVILITTKRGQQGKLELTYSSEITAKQPLMISKMFDSYQTALLVNEAHRNDGDFHLLYPDDVLEHFRTQDMPYIYPNSDWRKLLLKDFGFAHKHNINISAGNSFARVFSSLSYTHEGDILNTNKQINYNPQYQYNRYNYRTNADFNVTPTTVVSLDLGGFLGVQNEPYDNRPIRTFRPMMMLGPMEIPIWYPAEAVEQYPDKAHPEETGFRYSNTGILNSQNPYNALNNTGYSVWKSTELNATLKFDQKLDFITKGLSAQAKVAFNNVESYTKSYPLDDLSYRLMVDGSWVRYKGRENQDSEGAVTPIAPGAESISGTPFRRWYYEASLNYLRSFDKHNISGLVLVNRQKQQSDVQFPSYYEGIVSRVTYNYNTRYLFEFNLGINGSEKFAPNKRYGTFPSVTVGWNLHQEEFFKRLAPFVTKAKIRYSIGEVGSDNADRWLYVSEYANGGTNSNGFLPGTLTSPGRSITPIQEGSVANVNATWERAKKENLGFELGFFKDNMLSINADFYNENRDQILLSRTSLPAWFGVGTKQQNLGATQSKGYELEVKFNRNLSNGLKYWLGAGLNKTDNRVIKKDEPLYQLDYQKEEGKRINQRFGYITVGYIDDVDERAAIPQYGSSVVGLGDVVYIDFNGDGVIDPNDQVPFEYPGSYPLMFYNFSSGLSYKGFDMDINFQGATQTIRFLVDAFLFPLQRLTNQYLDYQSDYWRPDNNNNPDFPAVHTEPYRLHNNIGPTINKTLGMRDASYLRLKNAQVGYTIPKNLVSRLKVSDLRIYLQGTNLHTWTRNFPIGDPEGTDGGGDLSSGYYPLIRRFTLGFQIKF